MEFKTKYIRPENKGEKMDPHSITETAGYIPAEQRILSLQNAGAKLDAYRKALFNPEAYDAASDEEEPVLDVTRTPNFDMADASQLRMLSDENIRTKKAQRAKEIEEANKKARENVEEK